MNTQTNIINSNVLSVSKWCDSVGLKYINFKLDRDIDNNKKPCYLTKYYKKGVHDFSDEEIEDHNTRLEEDGIDDNFGKCNAISIRLKDSGWVMIDTDDAESEKFISNLNLECPTTTTSKGKHRFIKLEDYEFIKRIIKLNNLELDIITEFTWEVKTRKVNNPNKILTMTLTKFNTMLGIDKHYKETNKQVDKEVSNFQKEEPAQTTGHTVIKKIEKELLWDMLDNLDCNYFKSLNNWKNFLPAIYNQIPNKESTEEYKNKAFDFLRNIEGYNDTYELENYKYWEKITNGDYKHNSGVIFNWLKETNYDYFKKICKKIGKKLDINYFHKLDTYLEKKKYIENFIVRINTDGKILYAEKIYDGTIRQYTQSNLKERLQNFLLSVEAEDGKKCKTCEFTKAWLADQYIKTYEDLVFHPPPKSSNPDLYNLYDGLRMEKELLDIKGLGNIDRILKHIYYLAEENEINADFIIKQLAYKVKYPGKLPRVATVFRSKQGVGKNLLADWYGNYILGKRYYVCSANPESFLGKFNNRLLHKLLAVFNEVEGAGVHQQKAKLKSFITEEKIEYEAKHANSFDIDNFALIWFFSNSFNPVSIEDSDRRFVVFECSDTPIYLKSSGYFVDLIADMKNEEVQKAFYNYLVSYDIDEDYDFQNNRPITRAYNQMKTQSMPILVRFFKYMLENPTYNSIFNKAVSITDLFTVYTDFITTTKEKNDMSQHKFYILLSNYDNKILTKCKMGKNINGVEINRELTQDIVTTYDLI